MIRSSKPSSLVCPLATICGSKLPLRSRGIASSIAPSSPSTVLLEWPLRLLPLPRPARSPFSYPRCSLSSAPSARSSSFFLSSLKSPSSPSRSCGELYPCSSSSITSSLIARAMSVIPLLHRVHHGSNLHKISDTLLSGYVVRPPQARREKPRISAFTSANIDKIIALRPDLVLTFSDLQADIASDLICHGLDVHAFNQRSVAEILEMIRMLGAMVDASERAEELVGALEAGLAEARTRADNLKKRPRVFFEEWDDPLISGIAWVSERVEIAGGIDIFADRAKQAAAKDRVVTLEEVVARQP